MATVAKPFNSITQRFRVGSEVNDGDDLSPHSFGDLKTRGFITDKAEAPASPSFGKRATAPTDPASA